MLSRRDLSAQFQKTIEEVSTKMDKQSQDYVASLKENETYVGVFSTQCAVNWLTSRDGCKNSRLCIPLQSASEAKDVS